VASEFAEEDALERMLSAIAFAERRALLGCLLEAHKDANAGRTITELARATGTNRFTASRHLGVLRSAGLVTAVAVGTRRLHRIRLEAIVAIDDWLSPNIAAQLAAQAS
jgi:DNA-binding transcriptional ArsR family regulator